MEAIVGIFLDVSNDFHTVDHAIIFGKFEHYGIRRLALDWIGSYCSNMLNLMATFREMICRILLSSILGPAIFLLYINDIKFAGDTLGSLPCIYLKRMHGVQRLISIFIAGSKVSA